jgi:hypothetical protein
MLRQLAARALDHGTMVCEFRTKRRKSLDLSRNCYFLDRWDTFDDEPVLSVKERANF